MKLIPWIGVFMTAVSCFLSWWYHCDWWLIGVGIGLAIQAFSIAYLCDEK